MREFFLALILGLLKWALSSAAKGPESVEGSGPGKLEADLRKRLKQEGW